MIYVEASDVQIQVDTQTLTLTSLSKILWPKHQITKADYFQYIYEVSPYILPFIKDRALTLIRYPHGAAGPSFFQKNCPEYAPDFIPTEMVDDINYIVGGDLPTLYWLANQLALEIHVPFQLIHSTGPSEIVFDLDPPSRDAFELAVEAALLIKEVLDQLQMISFVKTSGNKGLQVYIPLPENTYSYEETRLFGDFIAEYLLNKRPQAFTTERLKKNRKGRLYLDIVQHAQGKTIVSPYTVRGNEDGLVAAPLFWEEVTPALRPEQFPIQNMIERIKTKGCPFAHFFSAKDHQPFDQVLSVLKRNKEKGVSL
jgi:DNA ligase D